MCGIAGIHRFDGAPVDAAQLEAMVDALEHRGPDDRGTWIDGSVGLGHTRLSIIDLDGSRQPMASPDGRLRLTFNGEIFNYRDVRTRLDYPFHTAGDTEVLLAALTLHGPDGVRDLRGQFACAAHDQRTRETWLIRDRIGVLPLYYMVSSELVAFASEIKALEPVFGARELDSEHLPAYLMRRAVPAPNTLVRGVRKVPAGHVVRVAPTGEVSVQRYWTLPPAAEVLDVSPNQAIDLVDRAVRDAVDDALVSDVPVGSYLSGGLDSSLVVALASDRVSRPLHTLSAEFGDARYDETLFASIVSRRFRTDHHTVPVRAHDFVDLWQQLSLHRDAPLSDPADIAVFRLAQAARQDVKVMLSGEGADELFGGYPKYRLAGLTDWTGHVPAAIRRRAFASVERLLPARANRARIAVRAQTGSSLSDRFDTWFAPFTAYECAELLGVEAPSLDEIEHRDAIDLMSRLDLASWLPDNLLERGDRMSMAASLELRPPYLDTRLVELAARLPSPYKVRHHKTKWILREVARRYLPTEIIDRPKIGFRVPLDAWFRSGLRDMSTDLLLSRDSVVSDLMDMRAVTRLVQDHERGRRNEEIRIWTLLSFEVWARQHLRVSAPIGLAIPCGISPPSNRACEHDAVPNPDEARPTAIASIVIPAHNEERGIVRLLTDLIAEANTGEFEVLVVTNGCTDRTADVARGFGPDVHVIDIATPSKYEALKRGDVETSTFPRLYIDADVEIDTVGVRALVAALNGPVLAAAPVRVVPRAGMSSLVAAYYDVWEQLPQVRNATFGRGVIAVSQPGHERIRALPPVMSDDLAMTAAFGAGEHTVVPGARVVVWPPRTMRDLLRRRIRVSTGNTQLDHGSGRAAELKTSPATLARLVREQPRLAVKLPVFVGIAIAARLGARRRIKRGDFSTWLRDESSRQNCD
jgi:asparagine synthase (glutamine-hydrolysing)